MLGCEVARMLLLHHAAHFCICGVQESQLTKISLDFYGWLPCITQAKVVKRSTRDNFFFKCRFISKTAK